MLDSVITLVTMFNDRKVPTKFQLIREKVGGESFLATLDLIFKFIDYKMSSPYDRSWNIRDSHFAIEVIHYMVEADPGLGEVFSLTDGKLDYSVGLSKDQRREIEEYVAEHRREIRVIVRRE